jgi:hypothetical protein
MIGSWLRLRLRNPAFLAGSAFAIIAIVVLVGIGSGRLAVDSASGPSASLDSIGPCVGYPDQCGVDYRTRASEEGSEAGQTAFIVAVDAGMTRNRAEQIALEFASRHSQGPVVVYLIPETGDDSIGGSFGAIPDPLTSATLQDVPDPEYDNWILTYASVPMAPPIERWGPGAAGMA